MIENHPGTFCDTLDSTLELLSAIDHPGITLLLDIANLPHYQLSPLEGEGRVRGSPFLLDLEGLMPWTHRIREIHVKNTRSFPKQWQTPLENACIAFRHSDLDQGILDWSQYFKKFRQWDFHGNIVLEWFSKAPLQKVSLQFSWMKHAYEHAS